MSALLAAVEDARVLGGHVAALSGPSLRKIAWRIRRRRNYDRVKYPFRTDGRWLQRPASTCVHPGWRLAATRS